MDFNDLTDDERRTLSHSARAQASLEVDTRYGNHYEKGKGLVSDLPWAERERRRDRWMEIANALHPNPYAPLPSLPRGLCEDRTGHDQHEMFCESLGQFLCTGDPDDREPGRSERRRAG